MTTRILLGVFALLTAACARQGRELVGAWSWTHAVSQGEAVKPGQSERLLRTFDGRFFENKFGTSVTGRARYVVDERLRPKRIEFVYADGPRKGEAFRGIYEVSGDRLRIATTSDGAIEPAAFESAKGSAVTIDFYERAK